MSGIPDPKNITIRFEPTRQYEYVGLDMWIMVKLDVKYEKIEQFHIDKLNQLYKTPLNIYDISENIIKLYSLESELSYAYNPDTRIEYPKVMDVVVVTIDSNGNIIVKLNANIIDKHNLIKEMKHIPKPFNLQRRVGWEFNM